MLRTGQAVNRTVLPDEWQPPFTLRADRTERPAPDRWGRFGRAANALAAIATTPDSNPPAVADAHDELARAAMELASQLDHAAPEQPRATGEVRCSFCERSNRHQEITRMISGPGINICDDCVSLCVEIIEDGRDRLNGSLVGAGAGTGPLPMVAPWRAPGGRGSGPRTRQGPPQHKGAPDGHHRPPAPAARGADDRA